MVLVILLFVGRIFLRMLRRQQANEPKKVERVEPAARIEGLDEHSIKVGESKTFEIAVQGLTCNDLRVSAAGLSIRKKDGEDCAFEVSSTQAGEGFIRVFGAGKALVDTFRITTVR